MSGIFFETLGLPKPDYSLSTNTGSPIKLISQIMSQLDKILEKEKPNIVVVVGDVSSTLAAALAAHKKQIKVAHVESGLRSGDKSMPEEINRILTDNISDHLFVTEKSGLLNLKKENIESHKVFFVGNVMIDNLINMLPRIEQSKIGEKLNLNDKKYAIMTMHRPVNVDNENGLNFIVELVESLVKENIKIVFPIHPRTQNNLKKHQNILARLNRVENLIITEPMEYLDFIKLVKNAKLVITDSGGIQEEAAYLKIPTITLRESTERPSTVDCRANHICHPQSVETIMTIVRKKIKMNRERILDIPLNDGQASRRIIDIFKKTYEKNN
jgi:UDP-N-acetylglucosamine 2-epimerase (non-hydrolysing)